MDVKKILFCTDFSTNCEPARKLSVDFAQAFDAELLILNVISSHALGYPFFEDRIELDLAALQRTIDERLGEELERVSNECRKELSAVSTFARTGETAAEIVEFAEESGADLIVMGTHGWTGIKHIVLGSAAENVVRKAKCPVMIVPS